jgi:hypothetical protein
MATRRTRKRRADSTGELQRMGGKEERVSRVGKARADVETREARGEERFDVAPGPRTGELLQGSKGSRRSRPVKRVSRKPRAGPSRLEPEDKAKTGRSGALSAKLRRQPAEQLPRDPEEPPEAGEIPEYPE